MKPAFKIFVITALTLMFVVFAASPMEQAVQQAISEDSRIQTQRLVSMINSMTTAPDGTKFVFDVTTKKCHIEINDDIIKMSLKQVTGVDVNFVKGLINNEAFVQPANFECRKNILLEKNNGIVIIRALP